MHWLSLCYVIIAPWHLPPPQFYKQRMSWANSQGVFYHWFWLISVWPWLLWNFIFSVAGPGQPPSGEMIENKQRILTNFAVHFWLHKEVWNKEKLPDLIYQWMPLINAIIGEPQHRGLWSLTIRIQIKPVSCHINHTKLAPAICDILSELTARPKYKYK